MAENDTIRQRRRDAVLDPICDYLLVHGLETANLRALAKAAGTSDRMLLYYFTDKDDLVEQALTRLGQRLSDSLAARTPDHPLPANDLRELIWKTVQEEEFWPYMVLFVEIITRSARTGEPYATAAKNIASGFLEWVSHRLLLEENDDRMTVARDVLATVDGRVLMRMTESR